MKRTALARTKPLDRGGPLRRETPLARSSGSLARSKGPARGKRPATRRPREKAGERVRAPGRTAWYSFPRYGRCEGCGRRRYRQAHHGLQEQYVERIAPEKVWDLRNRVLICEGCHDGHHKRGVNDRRIHYERLRAETIAFAREVLGDAAEVYFERRYRR